MMEFTFPNRFLRISAKPEVRDGGMNLKLHHADVTDTIAHITEAVDNILVKAGENERSYGMVEIKKQASFIKSLINGMGPTDA